MKLFVTLILAIAGFAATQVLDEKQVVSVRIIEKPHDNLSEGRILMVNLIFELREGIIHLNNQPINHAHINAVHFETDIIEIDGEGHHLGRSTKPIIARVMVREMEQSGRLVLTIQEEIVAVEGNEVDQVDVKEVVIFSDDRMSEVSRTMTSVRLEESKIHGMDRAHDLHCGNIRPLLPENPLSGDETLFNHHHRHHHHDRHHNERKVTFSCWFHKLSLRSRLCIAIVAILAICATTLCCVIYCKARRNRHNVLQISAGEPAVADVESNAAELDMEKVEEKVENKEAGDKMEFHMEISGEQVVIDDKLALLDSLIDH